LSLIKSDLSIPFSLGFEPINNTYFTLLKASAYDVHTLTLFNVLNPQSINSFSTPYIFFLKSGKSCKNKLIGVSSPNNCPLATLYATD